MYFLKVASGTKKQVASKKVITMEDTSKMNGESQEATQPTLINKPLVCVVSSGEKRPLTVPKGPNFMYLRAVVQIEWHYLSKISGLLHTGVL